MNIKEKSNSMTKAGTNYVWNKPLNWIEIHGHATPRLEKLKLKLKQ